MLLGAATAVLGVLYALMQSDLKRLLAYSARSRISASSSRRSASRWRSRRPARRPALRWRMTAALLHVLNHAVFKSLLFFGAGAVLHATGARDMERLGGLIHRMPQTALAMLVGAAAISALPPLNGFVSEWLMFQAILQQPAAAATGAALPGRRPSAPCSLWRPRLPPPASSRLYGIAFLGRPAHAEPVPAQEVDAWSRGSPCSVPLPCACSSACCRASSSTCWSRSVGLLVVGGMPGQGGQGWLSLVAGRRPAAAPITASSCSSSSPSRRAS